MLHSINDLSKTYSTLSMKRNDEKIFDESKFLSFVTNNIDKYSILLLKDTLYVNSFHVDSLITDFKKTL